MVCRGGLLLVVKGTDRQWPKCEAPAHRSSRLRAQFGNVMNPLHVYRIASSGHDATRAHAQIDERDRHVPLFVDRHDRDELAAGAVPFPPTEPFDAPLAKADVGGGDSAAYVEQTAQLSLDAGNGQDRRCHRGG